MKCYIIYSFLFLLTLSNKLHKFNEFGNDLQIIKRMVQPEYVSNNTHNDKIEIVKTNENDLRTINNKIFSQRPNYMSNVMTSVPTSTRSVHTINDGVVYDLDLVKRNRENERNIFNNVSTNENNFQMIDIDQKLNINKVLDERLNNNENISLLEKTSKINNETVNNKNDGSSKILNLPNNFNNLHNQLSNMNNQNNNNVQYNNQMHLNSNIPINNYSTNNMPSNSPFNNNLQGIGIMNQNLQQPFPSNIIPINNNNNFNNQVLVIPNNHQISPKQELSVLKEAALRYKDLRPDEKTNLLNKLKDIKTQIKSEIQSLDNQSTRYQKESVLIIETINNEINEQQNELDEIYRPLDSIMKEKVIKELSEEYFQILSGFSIDQSKYPLIPSLDQNDLNQFIKVFKTEIQKNGSFYINLNQ